MMNEAYECMHEVRSELFFLTNQAIENHYTETLQKGLFLEGELVCLHRFQVWNISLLKMS